MPVSPALKIAARSNKTTPVITRQIPETVMSKNTNTSAKTQTVELTKDKDCQGSVRFSTEQSGGVPPAITNVYVSRAMNGINDAKKVRVTIEVIE